MPLVRNKLYRGLILHLPQTPSANFGGVDTHISQTGYNALVLTIGLARMDLWEWEDER
jgi:hypothetical protein